MRPALSDNGRPTTSNGFTRMEPSSLSQEAPYQLEKLNPEPSAGTANRVRCPVPYDEL